MAAWSPRMTVSHTQEGLPAPSLREQGGHRLASEWKKTMGVAVDALGKPGFSQTLGDRQGPGNIKGTKAFP